jgi:hypothetical protein
VGTPGRRLAFAIAVCAPFALVAGSGILDAATAPDPLADAVERWQAKVRASGSVDEETKQIRDGAAPRLAEAERALAAGQRWLALSRLALVWSELEAAEYRNGVASDLRQQMAGLEREWQRLGPELARITATGRSTDFERLPAAARALAEAALAQVSVYYQASLDYGRNTAPDYGLFYLGAARAQRDLATWIAKLPPRPSDVRSLAPRDLRSEIAAAGNELAAAYSPPLSIDSHAVLIRISALLKEADELAVAGARFGALQRLLDARARISRLTHPGRTMTAGEASERARTVAAALDASPIDASLQRLFLETALFSATDPESRASGGGEVAAAIFADVLPAFPALLGPAPPRPPERRAEATVTLVRWPYT